MHANHFSGFLRNAIFCLWPAIFVAALTSCGSAPDNIIGVQPPEASTDAVPGIRRHHIFIATTRARDPDPTLLYSYVRSNALNLARVEVSIPPNHQQGQLERPKSLPPDPRRHMTVSEPLVYQKRDDFLSDVRGALAERPRKDRDILLFVHGFNTSLTDALLRIGQFVDDSGFEGVPVLFSWASHGKLLDYVYDLNSALHARDGLIDTAELLGRTRTRNFDIIAHSMGNFLTVEAMRQAKLEGVYNATGRIGSVILASPDIDLDVFRRQMSVFDKNEKAFYVLISDDDKALSTSRFLAGGINRVGDADAEELAKLGVTVIDLTQIDDANSLHHTKFADSPEVVQLLGSEILKGDSLNTPAQRTNALQDFSLGVVDAVSGGRVVTAR